MDGTQDTAAAPAPVTTTPVKPETLTQEFWDALETADQWLIAGLHAAGHFITQDIWPAFKAACAIFGSQLFPVIFAAATANIADPVLIGPAVGAAIVMTASTQGVVDAKQFIASVETAVANDPAVKAAFAQ